MVNAGMMIPESGTSPAKWGDLCSQADAFPGKAELLILQTLPFRANAGILVPESDAESGKMAKSGPATSADSGDMGIMTLESTAFAFDAGIFFPESTRATGKARKSGQKTPISSEDAGAIVPRMTRAIQTESFPTSNANAYSSQRWPPLTDPAIDPLQFCFCASAGFHSTAPLPSHEC